MKYKIGTKMWSKIDRNCSFIIIKINYADEVYQVRNEQDASLWWVTECTVEAYNLRFPKKKNRLPSWF